MTCNYLLKSPFGSREFCNNNNNNTGAEEVENMKLWSNENRMVLNMNKTYEMIVRGRTSIPLPSCIPSIKRKTWLKILGITLEEIPENWDRHFEEMLKKASGRMYILRVCRYYGFTTITALLNFSFRV